MLGIYRWEAPAGNTTSFTVPDNWKSGRIWVHLQFFNYLIRFVNLLMYRHKGRRDCDFSKPAVSACSTGSCNGGLLCDPHTGTVHIYFSSLSNQFSCARKLGNPPGNRSRMDSCRLWK